MLKNEVEIGKTYVARISGNLVPVKILEESRYGGWYGLNMKTKRRVRIRSAQKLRCEWGKSRLMKEV